MDTTTTCPPPIASPLRYRFFSPDVSGVSAFTAAQGRLARTRAYLADYERSGAAVRHSRAVEQADARLDEAIERSEEITGSIVRVQLGRNLWEAIESCKSPGQIGEAVLALTALVEGFTRIAWLNRIRSRKDFLRHMKAVYQCRFERPPVEIIGQLRETMFSAAGHLPPQAREFFRAFVESWFGEPDVTSIVMDAGAVAMHADLPQLEDRQAWREWHAEAEALDEDSLTTEWELRGAQLRQAFDLSRRAQERAFVATQRATAEMGLSQETQLQDFWGYIAIAGGYGGFIDMIRRLGGKAHTVGMPPVSNYFSSPLAWQMFLVRHHGAAALTDGIRALVDAPRTFIRWSGAAADRRAIGVTLRLFQPLLTGDARTGVEFQHLQSVSRTGTAEELLALFPQFLCHSYLRHRTTKLTKELLTAFPTDSTTLFELCEKGECVLAPVKLLTVEDAEFNQLLAEEAAQAARELEELQKWMRDHTPETDTADEVPAETPPVPGLPITLSYVLNFGSPRLKTVELNTDTEQLTFALKRFLFEHDVDTLIPPSSVAAALSHFLYDLTDEQKRALQSEEIAGVRWRKLKRGSQRIYFLQQDGRTYFHLIKRKDWKHSDNLAARFGRN